MTYKGNYQMRLFIKMIIGNVFIKKKLGCFSCETQFKIFLLTL